MEKISIKDCSQTLLEETLSTMKFLQSQKKKSIEFLARVILENHIALDYEQERICVFINTSYYAYLGEIETQLDSLHPKCTLA